MNISPLSLERSFRYGFAITTLALAALLGSSQTAKSAAVAAEATDNATVNISGPRTGNSGKNFFNAVGSSGAFPSYGVADFSASSFGLTSAATDITGELTIKLTQSLSPTANSGPINFYLTQLTEQSIQPSGGLIYDSTAGEEGLGAQLDPKFLLGSGVFTETASGTVDTYTFALSAEAETYFLSQLNSSTGILRLVITPTDAATAANWAGFSNTGTGLTGPTLSFDAALDPSGQYWDANGANAGVGGSGVWNNATPNFNPNAAGTAAVQVHDPAIRKVFGGTAGTVQIAAGITQNAVIEFVTAGYELSQGPLVLGSGTLVTSHAAGTSSTISAVLSGTAGITKSGPGTLVLSGANDFAGAVTIQQGVLRISSDGNLGNIDNDLVLAGGGLQTTANIALNAGRDISGTGTLDIQAGTTLSVAGAANFATVTFSNSGNFASSNAINVSEGINITNTTGTVTIAAPLVFPFGTHVINVADGSAAVDAIFSGDITAAGTFGTDKLHKVGIGTLELSGTSNAALSGVRIGTAGDVPVNGGRLRIANSSSLGAADLQFNGGTLEATTDLTGANALPIGISVGASTVVPAVFAGSPMEFTGAVSLFLASGGTYQHQITVNTAVTFAGGLNGSSGTALNIMGTGSLLLSGESNGLSLPTVVDGPSVTINGSLAAPLSVKTGTVSGNATLTSSFVVGDGVGNDAVLSPGNRLGNMAVTTLSFGSDATLRLEIDRALSVADQITATGLVELGAGIATLQVLDLSVGNLAAGFEFTILNNTSSEATTGFFEGRPDLAVFTVGSNAYQIDYNTGSDLNDIVLRVVPEPSGAALLMLGAAAFAARRRRPTASPLS